MPRPEARNTETYISLNNLLTGQVTDAVKSTRFTERRHDQWAGGTALNRPLLAAAQLALSVAKVDRIASCSNLLSSYLTSSAEAIVIRRRPGLSISRR